MLITDNPESTVVDGRDAILSLRMQVFNTTLCAVRTIDTRPEQQVDEGRVR